MPYQKKIITDLIATKRVKDDLRRYREAFITMGRKNSKSFIVACLFVYVLFTDKETGQENIIVANSKDQANNIYNMVEFMIRTNKTLAKHCTIVNSRRKILRKTTDSYIQILSSDTSKLDGYNPYFAVADETHEDKTGGNNYTKLQTGMGARKQPLMISVTTASNGQDEYNTEYKKYQYALKVINGEVEDDSFYSAIFAADDDCRLDDVEQWLKSNPALDTEEGGFRSSEELERLSKQALANPIEEASFRRYYLNQHVVLDNEQAINMSKWKLCGKDFDMSFLKGKECYAGLDLSIKKDFSAFVMVFPIDDNYYIVPHLFKPADTLQTDEKLDRFPYVKYANQERLHATKGDHVNFRYVRQIINELSMEYDIKQIALDKFASGGIASDLMNDGHIMVDTKQGFYLSPTISDFYELLFDQKLVHNNNPVMNWMAQNVVAKENPNGKIMFDREKASFKIDGIIALLMGLNRAVLSQKNSDYDSNEAIDDWLDM
nr:terminase TerL endonuclease subunit [Virgibacillus natechei]